MNAGASAAVVTASALFGVSTSAATSGSRSAGPRSYPCSSTSSAARAPRPRPGSPSPAPRSAPRCSRYVGAVELLDTDALDRMRFWTVGSLAGPICRPSPRSRRSSSSAACSRCCCARPLNTLALGDDPAVSLGAHLARTRVRRDARGHRCCAARRPRPAARSCSSGLMVPHVVRGHHRPRPALDPAVRRGAVARCCCSAPTSSGGSSPGPRSSRSASSPRSSAGPSSSLWYGAEGWPSCERPTRARRPARAGPPCAHRPARCSRSASTGPRRRASSLAARWPSRSPPPSCLIGTGDFPIAPGDVLRDAGRQRRPRAGVHHPANCGCRASWSALLVGAVARHRRARSSSPSPAIRWAAPTSSASPRARRPARSW